VNPLQSSVFNLQVPAIITAYKIIAYLRELFAIQLARSVQSTSCLGLYRPPVIPTCISHSHCKFSEPWRVGYHSARPPVLTILMVRSYHSSYTATKHRPNMAFLATGPSIWNGLPLELRSLPLDLSSLFYSLAYWRRFLPGPGLGAPLSRLFQRGAFGPCGRGPSIWKYGKSPHTFLPLQKFPPWTSLIV